MTLEAERLFKYGSEDRGARHLLGPHVLKPPRERAQKKKHLVAAALPSTPLSTSDCNSSSRDASLQPAHHWVSKSMLLTIVLVSTWFFQRNNHAPGSSILNAGDAQSGMLMQLAAQIADSSAALPCSGHGYLETGATCKCYDCFGGADCSQVINTCVIDLDHGDPTMFEDFWFRNGGNSITVILGYQRMSYFAQSKHVWFMESELDAQIRALHQVVGNAITKGRHIVVGTGSTQLFQAVLYALTSPDQPQPTNIVSAAPFYSSYPSVTDYLRSALFKWAGDAAKFDPSNSPYIEMVTSPNNPDGKIQRPIVNGTGHVVHDLAYYWPHYTPITEAADHDVMLFTLSKSTGHAGTRIGWAVLKDEKVAKKMVKFLELQTIGVSHDSQVRATQIIKAVVQGYASSRTDGVAEHQSFNRQSSSQYLDTNNNKLFHFGSTVMQYRWKRLRSALNASSELSILDFEPSYCTFFEKEVDHAPAFAWIRCNKVVDCQELLKQNRIITRSGRHFGVGPEYVRLSMLERNQKFEMMVDRLARIDSSRTPD